MGKKTEARRRGREKAVALIRAIDETAATLTNTQELRGFLQRISRGVYERRKPLYAKGLHPNQKR